MEKGKKYVFDSVIFNKYNNRNTETIKMMPLYGVIEEVWVSWPYFWWAQIKTNEVMTKSENTGIHTCKGKRTKTLQ